MKDISDLTVISRIAPTPSGYLHTGNAFNFILSWLITRKLGGSLRLRIDDLDAPRMRQEYLEDVFESLEWLGLDWDEGPHHSAEHLKFFSQQQRVNIYFSILDELKRKADCLYCNCSRSGNDLCSCNQKALAWVPGQTALKIKTPNDGGITFFDSSEKKVVNVDLNTEMKDFVILRKDGIPSYQVVSLADDLEYGVNLVVRGRDLLPSTAAQLFLAGKIGRNEFAATRFYHHTLQMDSLGQKLSKSAGSYSLKSLRQQGVPVEEIYRQFAMWRGWKSEPQTLSDMLHIFNAEG